MRPASLIVLFSISTACLNPADIMSAARPMESTIPLPRAHAHNDYEHAHPFFDAVSHGFCSIEADIYLVDGKLLVAHDRDKVKPERSLQSLYLDPLRDHVRRNGGRLYRGGPSAILLIDVKSEGEGTYAVLRNVLKNYADILTQFRDGKIETNAIMAIISGNRARKTMAAESVRYAAVDGRIEDLESNPPSSLVPLVSDNWSKVFKWRWKGKMPEEVQQLLGNLVSRAHAQGRQIRFWETPDRPDVWKALFDADVDLINTDNLAGLQKFLLDQHRR